MQKEQETNWSLIAATSVLVIGFSVIFKYVIQFNKDARTADGAQSSDDEGERVRWPARGAGVPAENNRAAAIVQRPQHDAPVKNTRYRKKLEDKELAREQKAEEEKKEAELLAAKEEQEFQEWKGLFEVEEAGDSADATTACLDQFVSYIRMRKVVMLEDLAFDFKLKTQDCIDRIRALEAMDRFDGFFDDRGKYICLEKDEMQSCASVLLEKGRINRADLVSICNSMIRMEPTEEHRQQIEEEEQQAVEALDWDDNES